MSHTVHGSVRAKRVLPIRALLLFACAAGLGCDSKLTICDIAQPSCQEDVYYADLRLRGDGNDPFGGLPPTRVITQDQYRQELLDEEAASTNALTDQDKKAQKAENTAFALLGFIDPNSNTTGTVIDDLVANTAAYYAPSSKTVTILSRPNSTVDSQANAMEILAHELIHALQDREFDLENRPNTYDKSLAFTALVEGDASLYEVLFLNELRSDIGAPINVTQGTIVSAMQQWADKIYGDFAGGGSPLFFPQRIRYPLGALYLASAWSTGGNAAVRRAYAAAPVYSLGFLGRGEAIDVREDCLPPSATGFTPVSTYHFGAIYFYAFLRAASLDHPTALSLAWSWRGDILHLAASPDGQFTAASWQIELDARPADSVVSALSARGTMTASAGASSLVITASDSGEPVDWVRSSACP